MPDKVIIQDNKVSRSWRTYAILVSILFLMLLFLIIYAYKTGTASINNELTCSNNICSGENVNAYLYDDYANICYCYSNDELVSSKFMG